MDPADPVPPDRSPTLPRGPHVTVGPGTVRMPAWPGPTLIASGAIVGFSAIVALAMVTTGSLTVRNETGILALAVAGGAAFTAGLVWVAVHQLRVRRFLPPERYRGPSVLVLTVLAIVLANLAAVPWIAEVLTLATADPQLSPVGTLVVLVSTQVALLAVAWLFVHRPRALAGLERWTGPDPWAAARTGLAWGVAVWLPATALAVAITLLLEAVGIEPEIEAAERILRAIDPWLVVVPIVVIAPIAEEVFFRGIVFNAFLREGGRRWAYLGSALLFGAIHLSLVSFLPIVLLGLALARVYERTRSLVAPIALHATFNGLSVAVALLERFEVIRVPF